MKVCNVNCQQALFDADNVIKLQDDLILKISKSNDDIRTENETFAKALVELKKEADKGFERNVSFGLIGVALGVLATTLLIHK